jgi:phage shock protein C
MKQYSQIGTARADGLASAVHKPKDSTMQTSQPNLLTRGDTMFGVCQGLGEDLGIHPNVLRVALAGLLFFFPVATIAGYGAAGLLVLMSRYLFPEPRRAVAEQSAEPEAVPVESNDTADVLLVAA